MKWHQMQNNQTNQIKLRAYFASAPSGSPWIPVVGEARLKEFKGTISLTGHINISDRPIVAHCVLKGPLVIKKRRGRRADRGKKISVYLAFMLLKISGISDAKAHEKITEILAFDDPRSVRRVLGEAGIRSLFDKSVVFCFLSDDEEKANSISMLCEGGDDILSVLDRPGTTDCSVSGWLWKYGNPEAEHGVWAFSITNEGGGQEIQS